LKIPRRRLLLVTLALATLALATFAATPLTAAGGDDGQNKHVVRGGGTSMVAGGTGAPSFIPVTTKFAFNWSGSAGRFECLALMPSAAAGTPGSGNFDTNAMYVTGTISSVDVKGNTAVLKGMAVVTGLGASVPAGSLKPYTLTVTSGGPGATLVLVVSGMTFNEIVIEGEIAF
jgi:hypothetical protein